MLKANGTLSWKGGYSLKVRSEIISVSNPVQTLDDGHFLTGGTYDKSTKLHSGFAAKIDSSRKVTFQNTSGNGGRSVFATADGGFFMFGDVTAGIRVSKVNSEGIVPGCSVFQSLGPTTGVLFGPLKIEDVILTESDDVSLEPLDFELSSIASNHRVSTVCN